MHFTRSFSDLFGVVNAAAANRARSTTSPAPTASATTPGRKTKVPSVYELVMKGVRSTPSSPATRKQRV